MGDENVSSSIVRWVLGGLCEAGSIDAKECKFTSSHKKFYTAAVNSGKKSQSEDK